MIVSLRGSLLWREGSEVCLDVGGVGYRVTVMPTTSVSLGEVGAEAFVHVYHHVREDAQVLYGFTSRDERATFETLIGTHGVGPALAMAILGVHPPAALAQVVADEDVAALCLVPGVGRKTAARLLVELRSRLDGLAPEADGSGVTSPGIPGGGGPDGLSVRSDVRDALLSLGYGPEEVAAAVRDLPGEAGDSPEDLLRLALQKLAAI